MNEAAVYDLISYFFMNEVSRGRTTTSTEIMIIILIMMIIIIIIIIGRKFYIKLEDIIPEEDGVSSPPQACSIAVDGSNRYVRVIYQIIKAKR